MNFEFSHPTLAAAEKFATQGDDRAMFEQLRNLSLDDFGLLLLSMPNNHFKGLSSRLPRMASAKVQQSWTGSDGITLLRQSLNFVRVVNSAYEKHTSAKLSNARILDYGCGYGRLLRLFMYFADNNKLAGCDPWDESIRLCRNDGIDCKLDVTDYLPVALPYEPASFDLVFAFSVFTHTSERATKMALAALRNVIAPNGLLALTIRPLEYWDIDAHHSAAAAKLKALHRSEGFVFMPHQRQAVDGDITYGDTSMSFDVLARLAPGWRQVGYDRTLDDAYQIIVYMKPVA